MEYLTPTLVSAMLSESVNKANRKSRARFSYGGTVHKGKVSVELAGTHEGKVGSVRRSRKGRTTRVPNGKRYYLYGEADWYKL